MTAVGILDPAVRSFLESVPIGVLATVRRDGKSRQSTVYFCLDGSAVWMSTEADRAKSGDVDRTGWASLCVVGPGAPYSSVTVEGPAKIQTTDLATMTARVWAPLFGGEIPELTEADLRASGRVLLRVDIERVYGASYLPDPEAP